ncbi:MAG: hypothetical protein DMG06_29335 [Acidobacteria bacterium]|nr:MAG: hypothetical protein DMG06_29335 [Acidobacteriota bacterium]
MVASNSFPNTTASWPPEIRTEIRALHHLHPWANSVVLLYPALWICSMALMESWRNWPVRITGILIIGISIQAMAILMHEALHGNLFRRPMLDRWVGFILAVPAFFSTTAYKVAHLNHHRHTRTEKDQDEISNLCRTHKQYVALFYLWFLLGTIIYMFIVPWKALAIASRKDRHRIIVEYVLMFLVYGMAITLGLAKGHTGWLLWYWLLPAQVAIVLSNARGLAEHLGTPGKGDAIRQTRTVTTNRFVSFLMLNLNYQLEHHLFPGVPWYSLPRLHRLLKPICESRGADVRRSYAAYAIQCLREGPERLIYHGKEKYLE